MILHLASASGNVFGYLWRADLPGEVDGAALAALLCPKGDGFGLDGLFLLGPAEQEPWVLEHWDTDGSHTFCSNGSRAALAVPGAPVGEDLEAVCSGTRIALRRRGDAVGIRMPEEAPCGLRPLPVAMDLPAGFGWVGNPQLVLEVPAVDEVDLAALAPPLRHHPAILGGTNVNVVEVQGLGRARIRSWERGVEGETLCCGTGCAVAAAWLAERTGCTQWRFRPAGRDAVDVELGWAGTGRWTGLWVQGKVRRLGRVEVDPDLLSGL